MIRTFAVFQQHNLATSEECSQVAGIVKSSWTNGDGADPLESLVKLRMIEGENMDELVESLSYDMAQALDTSPLRIPFLSSLIIPNAFYEKYPSVARLCRLMMVPVTYNEDADVIGLTSINTYFSEAMAAIIVDEMKAYSNVVPFVNISRVSHSNWTKMCKKHFREEGQS